MALAIENARLFEEDQRRLREITTLYEASRACLSISDQESLLVAIIKAAARTTGATLGSVMLADEEKGEYVFGANYGMSEETIAALRTELHIPLEEGLVGVVVTTGQPLVIADVTTDPRWVPLETRDPMRSFLGVPLASRDGRPLGAITLSHPEVGAFDEDHARLLSTFANQAALAIENARLFEATQARARRERLIREITGKVQRSVDLDSILQTTVQELGKALGASRAAIRLGTEAESSLSNQVEKRTLGTQQKEM
jgi:GAF domain-containing protein